MRPRPPTTIDMGRDNSPSRPGQFGNPGPAHESQGPGSYDPSPQYDMGREVKSFTIGEKRLEKVEYDNRDYQSKAVESPKGGNFSKSPKAAEHVRDNDNVGPGAYTAPGIQPFTKDVKGGRIMPIGREHDVRDTNLGPGTYTYTHESSKQVHSTINMSRSPGRPAKNNWVNEDAVGPGGYDGGD